jgi:hypothetical protein
LAGALPRDSVNHPDGSFELFTGVARRILDIAMPQVGLQRPSIVDRTGLNECAALSYDRKELAAMRHK